MLTFIIITTVAGFLLGLRFKILVLVPASVLMTVAITFTGVTNGHGFWTVALTIITTVVLLQCAYFIGCIMKVLIPACPYAGRRYIFDAPGTPPSVM